MTPTLRDEIRLHVAWLRGAVGPFLPADAPAPARRGAAAPGGSADGPARGRGGAASADAARSSGRGAGARADRGAGAAEAAARLAAVVEGVAACRRCGLCETRTQTVPGEGVARPRLVLVGEAPGADEDRTGRPFVGRAGELLTRMLAAIGLAREDVFILNVLKCRPPGNRAPRPDEVAACKPWLQEQLQALDPPLLLALGAHAARTLLATERGIGSLRGRIATTPDGWRVLPTWHPAYLLRNPAAKREAWEDLQRVAADLGLEIPPRG